jgi:hypothetical protein
MHAIPGLLMAKHECCLSMNSEAKLKKKYTTSRFLYAHSNVKEKGGLSREENDQRCGERDMGKFIQSITLVHI